MKRNKYIGLTMMAAAMFAATSCTDFRDYNEAPADAVSSGNQTLWENIQGNSQLSQFAALLKRTKFDEQLSASRSYTVWAPLDGTFDYEAYNAMSDSLLLQQFVKSHIAEFSHGASGAVNERVHTLNEKSFTFQGDGTYTFDGVSISKPNQPSTNGLMHLMDGAATFHPNLFEYVAEGGRFNMLRDYVMQYNDTTLSSESVKGPIVDGVQTYLDSVLVVTNTLLRNRLGARIENEDSSYTFIIPTDEAYQKLYDKVKSRYNFISSTVVQQPQEFSSASATNSVTVTTNATYLSDSLTRSTIARNLIYSNNDAYNQWVVGKGPETDTLRSTTRYKLSNPDELLNKYLAEEPIALSNGYARLVDSVAYLPWETYTPEYEINPRYYLMNLFGGSSHSQSINDPSSVVFGKESGITEFRYLWIEPGGGYSKPDFFIGLPGVMSTTYNFYVVMLPTAWNVFGGETRPNKLNFQLNYCQANGKTANYNFSKAYADSLKTGGKLPTVPTSVNMNTAFENDPTKTDTIFIGRFTFPVCYNGLGSDYMPYIRVTSPINVFLPTQMAAYSRDVRMAFILMTPVEYDEFKANNNKK